VTRARTEKRPVHASRGMVVTNHPLASAAGVEMLAGGGNAVDAAVAALFALSVVEPMMVGVFGAGHAQLWLAGLHTVIDGYTVAPAAARPDMYRPRSDTWPEYMEAEGRENSVGLRSVGVPGTLAAWCEMLARFGTLDLPTVVAPAIRHAESGFRVTGYLAECIAETAADLARFEETARVFLPGGAPPGRGDRLVQPEYAGTLRTIAAEGPGALYGGALGRRVVEHMRRAGGLITLDDLRRYRTVERAPVRGSYRGFEVAGCPPPTGGGIHLIQILNLLEGYDVAGLGFLGLGPQDPATPEWGTMLSDVNDYLQTAPWLAIVPGVAIVVSVLGFNLIGDGLREALDPKLRGRTGKFRERSMFWFLGAGRRRALRGV